jgi:hypothetical protein
MRAFTSAVMFGCFGALAACAGETIEPPEWDAEENPPIDPPASEGSEDGSYDPDDADDPEDGDAGLYPSIGGGSFEDLIAEAGRTGIATAQPGDVLWTSAAWANGEARSMTRAHDYDPFDDQLELAAGTGRRWSTTGDGTSKLEGNRSRIYLHAPHRNVEMVFEANATDTRLENISTKLRSRHNEGGGPSHRFGGYGVAFNLKAQRADFKIESFHNDHESGRRHAFPQRVFYNQWYRYKVTIQSKDNDTKAVVKAYIDYALDGTWTWLGTETYNRTGYRKNDVSAKYTWIRANSGDNVQRGLKLRNASITVIEPL